MRALAEAYGMRLREVPSLHSDALAERMGLKLLPGRRGRARAGAVTGFVSNAIAMQVTKPNVTAPASQYGGI